MIWVWFGVAMELIAIASPGNVRNLETSMQAGEPRNLHLLAIVPIIGSSLWCDI